jgi:hypothetical protein
MIPIGVEDLPAADQLASAQFVVLASGNAATGIVDHLDRLSRDHEIPMLSLTVDSTGISLAHYHFATPGSCAVCHASRTLLNSPAQQGDLLLRTFFDENPSDCSAGYFPPFVHLAAQWIQHSCLGTTYGIQAGVVRHCSFARAVVTEERLLPVSGCLRCGIEHDRCNELRRELAPYVTANE